MSILEPIAVTVSSMMSMSVPRAVFSRMFLVSSRFFRVMGSIVIYSVFLWRRMLLMWLSVVIWVSLRYAMSAPADDTATGYSAMPNPSIDATSRCAFSVSSAL